MATMNDPESVVPLFLRKTYHMIDTCDPAIAGWSDDGETFVVKDPTRFEQTIIPQFFKHSKFSSFVRQLNFYSFRKIKYSDTLRIDPELEKVTANYWRFKHDSFQRGKPHLLSSIKRTQSVSKDALVGSSALSSVKPEVVKSNNVVNNATAAEVHTLKLRIEAMTKNIDELTAMVKEVSLKQEEQEDYPGSSVGYKRKKVAVESAAAAMNEDYSYSDDEMRPDEMISSMDLDDIIALPVPSMPSMPEPVAPVRETSSSTQVSDLEFVDTLFVAFKDDPVDDDDVFILDNDMPAQPQKLPDTKVSRDATAVTDCSSNRPDAELMRRLSDALMLLPKETQEMIVNRLIAAITSTDFITNSGSTGTSYVTTSSNDNKVVVEKVVAEVPQTEEEEKKSPYPLAAATLAALLQHYTSQLQRGENSTPANKSGAVAKSIPVIPVHA